MDGEIVRSIMKLNSEKIQDIQDILNMVNNKGIEAAVE